MTDAMDGILKMIAVVEFLLLLTALAALMAMGMVWAGMTL